ncbi:M56 family metallopeptidase [Paludisphaera rhizosphaerae]|uniref:M56 family metallopeptidase n=1 Tax=Paludisphaera rhizosphaerae TaxID=2711216 RepID=UPI0013E9D183|nr:M56 family metallopeptidase [Paludisphaera rhizosphaerae]
MDWYSLVSGRLVDAAVGGLIVLVVGSLAARLSHQPVRRVRIVLLTLLGAAVVPFLDRLPVAPRWSVGVLPAPAIAEPRATPPAPPALPLVATRVPMATAEIGNRVVATHRNEAKPEPERPAVEARGWAMPSIGSLMVAGYAAAAAGLAAWWLLGQAAFWRVVRAARPASEKVRDVFLEIAGPAGRRVRLLESDQVDLPFTNTWIHPVILLPAGLCDGREVETLRYALAHEWSHVERRDSWAWTLAMLSGMVLFYQPLFWWLRRQLRLGQDFLADARAAEVGSAEDYAAFLVRLARSKQAGPTWPALGIGDRRSNLHRRVLMLVQSQPLEKRCRPAWNAAVALPSIVVVLIASGLRLDAAPPAKEEAAVQDAAKPAGETLHYKGTVRDKDTGKPIAGAAVTVRRSDSLYLENRVIEESRHTTAADGTYEFTIPPEQTAVPRLRIELDVSHPDYATREGFGYALGVIRKNEKLGEQPFFESFELRPAKPIMGKVETPEGKPASGVEVQAFSKVENLPGDEYEYGSFSKTKTDADGLFRLPITTPGSGVFWILPTTSAPETHVLADGRRGDLGTFRLKPGVRLSGKSLDVEGKPKPGVLVEIRRIYSDEPGVDVLGRLGVGEYIRKIVETDAEGRFVSEPLPLGVYRVRLTDMDDRGGRSAGSKRRESPGPYPHLVVYVKKGETPTPVELRETPSVILEGGWFDSKGRPRAGWPSMVGGSLDGLPWYDETQPDAQGRFSMRLPRGLLGSTLFLTLTEDAAARHRAGKDAPLLEGDEIRMGRLDRDVKGIEIIRYKAPVIVIHAVTKDGKQISGFQADVVYTGEAGLGSHMVGLAGHGKTFEKGIEDKRNDGRYRTFQLLPDREVKIRVTAEGFAPAERTMKLAEGVTEEANFVLEPR